MIAGLPTANHCLMRIAKRVNGFSRGLAYSGFSKIIFGG
jgi:hypothetical protein